MGAVAVPARARYHCGMKTSDAPMGNPALIARIRAEIIEAGGQIPFARYMALALTHPVHGYYASGRGAPGRDAADFLTAPETSPYFGRALAVQVAECWHLLGEPATYAIWEPGAGAGTLARTLLDALRQDDPGAYAATTYWLDDLSPPSLDRARTALHDHSGRVAWDTPPQGMIGIVITNEFFDALPVHRVRREAHGIREAYVGWEDAHGAFIERWDAPSTPALADSFEASGIQLTEGQIAEVSLAATQWIRQIADRIGQGYVLTIDYGDVASALYRPGRFPEGSLMCYYRHTANRDPYQHIGAQDMTAHVDFTAIERAGARAGLVTLGLTTQAAFLTSLGLGEMLYTATITATDPFQYIGARNAVVRLIEPSAMGRNRVLLQGKSVSTEPRLRGLTEAPI